MSFGASSDTKRAMNNLGGISQQATAASDADRASGGKLLNLGGGNVASGTNFFNTLLNGDQANTTALLAPDINRIRAMGATTLQGLSTLMPRGGGRYGGLFSAAYAPTNAITNLFNTGRTTAATALPEIGLRQQSLGTNLFQIGNSALNPAVAASGQLGDLGQRQNQISNALWGGIGSGLFKLATLPVGGDATVASKIAGLF